MKTILALLVIITFLGSSFIFTRNEETPVPIPASQQRAGGNVQKGYEYLITGDYLKSGVPLNLFKLASMGDKVYLQREGINKNIPHAYTAVTATNGEIVVAPNCLQCHAQVFDGQLVMGLGNSLADFTKNERFNVENINLLEKFLKLNSKEKYEAAYPFIRASKATIGKLYADVKGVNIADRLAGLLVAHRDPTTLQWIDQVKLEIPKEVIPTDTPAWWLLKKKNAMFYNGFGRGDFGRFLMASNLLTVNDTSEARMVDEHMPDVLAYIYSLEAPKYTKPIDEVLAAQGKQIFELSCSGCHGTYGQGGSYPNLLIPGTIVQTDSLLYKSNYSSPQFVDWFNKSWFTNGDHPARLEPFNGYIAPPLDGIWVTAPYLHNGSVPTLEALLNSKTRPVYWSRDFDNPQYDYSNVGWVYEIEKKATNTSTYNTTKPGYSAEGHTFGDAFTDKERKAVIEYLKTL